MSRGSEKISYEIWQFLQGLVASRRLLVRPRFLENLEEFSMDVLLVEDMIGSDGASITNGVTTCKSHVKALVKKPFASDGR